MHKNIEDVKQIKTRLTLGPLEEVQGDTLRQRLFGSPSYPQLSPLLADDPSSTVLHQSKTNTSPSF